MESYSDYIEQFLIHLNSLNYSKKTIKLRGIALRDFTDYINETYSSKRVQDITQRHLEEYQCHLLRKFKPQTVGSYSSALKQLFAYLTDNFIIFESPAKDIKGPQMPKTLPEILSEQEIFKLLNSIKNKRDLAIFEFLYSTGARKEETLAMKLTDLNLSNQCVRLLGKGNKERLIPVGTTAIQAIEDYLRDIRPAYKSVDSADFIWLSSWGTPLSADTLDQAVRKLRSKTGIDFSPHTLRRSCATHLLNNGASPFIIAELLGHESLKTLSHYLKVSVTELRKMHEKSSLGQ